MAMLKYSALVAAITVCLFAVVSATSLRYGVSEFSIQDEETLLFDLLMNTQRRGVATRLGKWSYKNCGDPASELLVLDSLTLGPDPLSFPGDLTVSFSGQIKTTVDAPLKAKVLLQRKVGSSWIKIPCLGVIGSCDYADLCTLLSGATCPPPFASNKIPCKCPFTQGTYKLPTASFEVDAAVFPPGDYQASANLTMNGKPVSCIAITATFD